MKEQTMVIKVKLKPIFYAKLFAFRISRSMKYGEKFMEDIKSNPLKYAKISNRIE